MISAFPFLQPATRDIAPAASGLIYLTMGEMADYLFGADNSQNARQLLERLFKAKSNRFSYQFTEAVSLSGKVAGLVVAYSGQVMRSLELPTALRLLQAGGMVGFLRFIGRAAPLFRIKEAETDEFFISNIVVFPEFQGRGLGSAMLVQVEQKARAQGFQKISLSVDIENERAFALYQRCGFKVVGRIEIEALRKRFGYGGLYRMLKVLD